MKQPINPIDMKASRHQTKNPEAAPSLKTTTEAPYTSEKKTIAVERCGTLYQVRFTGIIQLAALIGAIQHYEQNTYLNIPITWNQIEVVAVCDEQDVRDMNAERDECRNALAMLRTQCGLNS